MMDQRQKFSPSGLTTEFICGEQTDPLVRERVKKGEVQLVFITPESVIENQTYRNMLLSPPYRKSLVALVVDEAHCVKVWGDEFRTAFAQIGDLRSLIAKKVKIMALTATATTETFYVVTSRLSMDNPKLIALPPSRENIMYHFHPKINLSSL